MEATTQRLITDDNTAATIMTNDVMLQQLKPSAPQSILLSSGEEDNEGNHNTKDHHHGYHTAYHTAATSISHSTPHPGAAGSAIATAIVTSTATATATATVTAGGVKRPRRVISSAPTRRKNKAMIIATNRAGDRNNQRDRGEEQQQSKRIHGCQATEHDVLCGRGNGFLQHPGNILYHKLIKKYKAIYQSEEYAGTSFGTNKKKKELVDKVVRKIYSLSPPGRFLKFVGYTSPGGAGGILSKVRKEETYLLIDDPKQVFRKVSQALREKENKKPQNKQSFPQKKAHKNDYKNNHKNSKEVASPLRRTSKNIIAELGESPQQKPRQQDLRNSSTSATYDEGYDANHHHLFTPRRPQQVSILSSSTGDSFSSSGGDDEEDSSTDKIHQHLIINGYDEEEQGFTSSDNDSPTSKFLNNTKNKQCTSGTTHSSGRIEKESKRKPPTHFKLPMKLINIVKDLEERGSPKRFIIDNERILTTGNDDDGHHGGRDDHDDRKIYGRPLDHNLAFLLRVAVDKEKGMAESK